MESVRLKALVPEDLPIFRSVLGGPEFGGCFCAVWTSYDPTWETRCRDAAQPNFAITAGRVSAGDHTGYLVYRGDEVVGWTGTGPKAQFPQLAAKLASRLTPSAPDVWAVGCMAITKAWQGKGLAEQIIQAVIAQARADGAVAIEAYPTRPWDEPRSFRGRESLYRRLGFMEIATEPDDEAEIILLRLDLTS